MIIQMSLEVLDYFLDRRTDQDEEEREQRSVTSCGGYSRNLLPMEFKDEEILRVRRSECRFIRFQTGEDGPVEPLMVTSTHLHARHEKEKHVRVLTELIEEEPRQKIETRVFRRRYLVTFKLVLAIDNDLTMLFQSLGAGRE